MTAPIGTSFRLTASRARSSAFRMYCSSIASGDVATPNGSLAVLLSGGKRWLFRFLERELAFGVALDNDVISLAEFALEYCEGEGILQKPLDCPLERTRAECGIVPFCGKHLARLGRQLEGQLPVRQQALRFLELKIDDVLDLCFAQWAEDDDVVDAVEELGAEVLPERVRHLRLDHSAVISSVLENVGAPDVRRHDNDGVPEIDRAPLRIGEPSIVQDLEKDVEYIGMCFFDFVEEHHRVRSATHGLGELPSFLEADITGRSADQARHSVLLHVLRHVDAHHRLLVVEQELG